MNAPKISQTVLLENPESAQLKEALSGLKPGFASCSGEYRTYSDKPRDQSHADQADGSARQRFKHQTDNHAGENREIIPRVLWQPCRRGDKSDNNRHHNRCKMLPSEFHVALPFGIRKRGARVGCRGWGEVRTPRHPTLDTRHSTLLLDHFHPTDTIFRLRNAICVASGKFFGQTSWQASSDMQPKTPSSSPINS